MGYNDHWKFQLCLGGGMTRFTVHLATESDHLAWNDYVHRHADATFFHLFQWRALLAEVFRQQGHYLLARQAGRVVGILPLARQKSLLFGDALISTPFCVYGGAVADDATIATALEEQAAALAREMAVDYLLLRRSGPPRQDWVQDPRYFTFQKNIDRDPQANLLAIPRKQRAEVRQAMGLGLTAVEEQDASQCYHLFSRSQRDLGTPVLPEKWFHALQAAFGRQCHLLVVRRGREPVASVLSFLFRDQVLPYYAGSGLSCRRWSGHPFLYWSLMNIAASQGCRLFDFGRSKQGSGSFAFKVNFGFSPQPLGYSVLPVAAPGLPGHTPNNPKYRWLIGLWRRLPLTLANRLGPWISSGLG